MATFFIAKIFPLLEKMNLYIKTNQIGQLYSYMYAVIIQEIKNYKYVAANV